MAETESQLTTARVLALTQFCGVTPRLFDVLMRRFQTLDGVFGASRSAYVEIDGIPQAQVAKLAKASNRLADAEAMMTALTARGIELITRFDDAYCHLLFELNDPPVLLFVRGSVIDTSRRTIAVVGTSKATAEGIESTSRLVKELVSRDVQIVSSLRGGIDTAVHLAARAVGGKSYAVIDCGIDHIDQSEGVPVAIDIARSGGVISEYAPDVTVGPKSMSASNRLIIGLAQAVVVTEVYAASARTLDLLGACRDIGKLTFLMVDPRHGALSDAYSLAAAHDYGAIPIDGLTKVNDIVKSLV